MSVPTSAPPRSSIHAPRRALGLSALLLPTLLLGCPSPTGNPYGKHEPTPIPEVGADDPRVVARDGELYTQKTIERADDKMGNDGEAGLGSGRPDETNGECRLFAPKLPHPQCCTNDLGFDAQTVQDACGLSPYLGESFWQTCGYYFHHDEGPRWFRLSRLPETSAKQAAVHHDRKMKEVLGDAYQASTPVPGVKGAWWSHHERYRWAFLPGWDQVRQLSWEEASCSDEGVTKVMAQLVAAKPSPDQARRVSLVPKARM